MAAGIRYCRGEGEQRHVHALRVGTLLTDGRRVATIRAIVASDDALRVEISIREGVEVEAAETLQRAPWRPVDCWVCRKG